MQNLTDNSGIYILELHSKTNFNFDHKKFGKLKLPAGYYYYIGSAQKNLAQRITRHFRKNKKLHWHIDYLIKKRSIKLINAYLLENYGKEGECKLVRDLQTEFGLKSIIKNFGNSDCRNCESHLLYSEESINYNQLLSLYHSTVLFIPSSKEIS